MGKFKYRLALLAAKASVLALKITKHNATNFPGIVALRICPDFLKYIAKPKHIIAITGTNGKTTISNLVNDLLAQLGIEALNNSMGSNINTGIATCLISGVTLTGKEKYDTAVLEIDERSAKRIFPYVKPDEMIVINLSRDSIMRNAHPEYIRDFLTDAMPEKTKLILNADDSIASKVAPNNPRVYFGIEEMQGDKTECNNLIQDMQICPKCHSKLKYKYIRYSNIGKAYCPNCDYTSPDYDASAYDVNLENMTMKFHGNGEDAELPILNDGVFNIYNQVAACTLLQQLGYNMLNIRRVMENVNITKSRFDDTEIGDKHVINMLCKEKNAYAASRVFEFISQAPGDKEILLLHNCIGDTHHWSENTCWLYDCDFELLANDSVKHVIVYGDRGLDYKFRLIMAGVPEDRITYVNKASEAPEALKMIPNDNIYVLYGTDSYALGQATGKTVRSRVKEFVEKHQEVE